MHVYDVVAGVILIDMVVLGLVQMPHEVLSTSFVILPSIIVLISAYV